MNQREAGARCFFYASESRGNALGELGLSRSKWSLQTNDDARLHQGGNLFSETDRFPRSSTDHAILGEQFVQKWFSVCHGKVNLVRSQS